METIKLHKTISTILTVEDFGTASKPDVRLNFLNLISDGGNEDCELFSRCTFKFNEIEWNSLKEQILNFKTSKEAANAE